MEPTAQVVGSNEWLPMEQAQRQRIQDWMIRLADGDRSAFEPLYEVLWPLLRQFAGRLSIHAAEAEDAAQEALIKVFRRAGEFDVQRDALSWAFGITAYQCRTLRQKRRRRREESTTLQTLEAIEDPMVMEQKFIEEQLFTAAEELLGDLSPQDRETLKLSVHNSRAANVSASTFRKRVQRARQRLQAAWRMKYGAH